MVERLSRLRARPARLVAGVMSGTSADGVDVALVRIEGAGVETRSSLVLHRTRRYEPAIGARLHAVMEGGTSREVCEVGFLLAEIHADAVLALLREAGLVPGDLDLVGSHGQTVSHRPPAGTLQIGSAAVIAERTGAVVVSDFRARDVAVGGSGAPLVPYPDWLMFRRPGRVVAVLNVGGIANITVVTERLEDVIALDTGPGNMVIDDLARRATGGQAAFDEDGRLAAQGRVVGPILDRLLAHPFLAVPPPRSTGREAFGAAFAADLLASSAPLGDLLATATAFTARSVSDAFTRFVHPRVRVDEVLVAGGGARNPTLMAMLTEALAPVPVRILDAPPAEAREAIAFAVLANEALFGNPGNLPQATGARRRVVLGSFTI